MHIKMLKISVGLLLMRPVRAVAALCCTLAFFIMREKGCVVACQMLMAQRCCSGRRHYDSNSSDTELSEAEESRKSCIKRSKLVCCLFDVTVQLCNMPPSPPVLMCCQQLNLPISLQCFLSAVQPPCILVLCSHFVRLLFHICLSFSSWFSSY